MRIRDLLQATPLDRRDAERLLEHVLQRNSAWLVAHDDEALSHDTYAQFRALEARRQTGEPLAYIVGEQMFYGRSFRVGPGILIPRPCTEEVITAATAMIDGSRIDPVRDIDNDIVLVSRAWGDCSTVRTIVDVGTGSGCIAITLACERAEVRCIAIDVSDRAAAVTRENAVRHGVAHRVEVLVGDLLAPVTNFQEAFMVVSNPPYVADASLLSPEVRAHEPHTALMGGGSHGDEIVRRLAIEASAHPQCRGIVIECLAAQAATVQDLLPT